MTLDLYTSLSYKQASNFTENDPKILDLKSSSQQIIFRKLSLGAPDIFSVIKKKPASGIVNKINASRI